MDDKAKDLFRYKGVLAVKGMDDKYVFQGVHMVYDGDFDKRFPWGAEEIHIVVTRRRCLE